MPKSKRTVVKPDNRALQILTHILGLFTGFIGALVVMLVAEDKETKNHARYALNWQISAWIYIIVSIPLMLLLVGFLTLIATVILNLIFCIIAAVKASNEELWNYPLAIPFFKAE